MCGLSGFLDLGGGSGRGDAAALEATATAMASALVHRGPDDAGAWADAETGIAFGFRRLAIVDLSPCGHQPMLSADERYVLSFNGELYNFRVLRTELEGQGHRFRGHSDTEVMLAAFSQWGFDEALRRFNGMFAFGLWDRAERTLRLVRDRLGEKPLYHAWMGRTLLFGSELKALRRHPAFSAGVDPDVLALFLRHNYVPSPWTIYEGVSKLAPGTVLTVEAGAGGRTSTRAYWSAADSALHGAREPFSGSAADAEDELDRRLREAVGLRTYADVPLGAFLSGGIDSSAVVALMQSQATRPVQTFTIGFDDATYNEAHDARAIAEHLGTEHTELYVTPPDAMEVIPSLPSIYDEPFADTSQIPTLLVSRLARSKVTVALSGDGGDELFGGYNRYSWGREIWRRSGWMPPAGRHAVAGALERPSWAAWDRFFRTGQRVLPARLRQRTPADKVRKVARMLRADGPAELYRTLTSYWDPPDALVPGAREPVTAMTDPALRPPLPDVSEQMMWLDMVGYLPDHNLAKVDRASMSVSLEARAPLVDHTLVEFAWTLPLQLKIRGDEGKWLLRRVLERYVPRTLFDRPKMGFGIPVGSWLRGDLRPWAEELLDPGRLRREGFLDAEVVRTAWDEHLSGRRNLQHELWGVLSFQAWLEHTAPGTGHRSG